MICGIYRNIIWEQQGDGNIGERRLAMSWYILLMFKLMSCTEEFILPSGPLLSVLGNLHNKHFKRGMRQSFNNSITLFEYRCYGC